MADFAGAAYALRLALEASEEGIAARTNFWQRSHIELRNPLSAARNASQYVQSRLQASDDPHLQSMLHVGERQLTSMSRMIDDLLDLARIRLDKVELKKERVSVETIMQQSVDSCFLLIEASQHQLMISLPNEPLWVEGDLLRLTQIVSNLLTNAAKYTPEGGRIEVNAGCAGENAVIRVRDNGIGISNSMLSSIFDLYAQGDAAEKERKEDWVSVSPSCNGSWSFTVDTFRCTVTGSAQAVNSSCVYPLPAGERRPSALLRTCVPLLQRAACCAFSSLMTTGTRPTVSRSCWVPMGTKLVRHTTGHPHSNSRNHSDRKWYCRTSACPAWMGTKLRGNFVDCPRREKQH